MKHFKKEFCIIAAVLFTAGGILQAQNQEQSDNSNGMSVSPVRPVTPVKPVVPSVEFGKMKMPEFPTAPQKKTSDKNTNGQYTPGQKYTKTEQQTGTKPAETKQAPQELTKEAVLKELDSISATDLTALSGQGLLPNIASLLTGANAGLTNSTVGNTNQNAVLEKILKELNEIKAAQEEIKKPDFSKLKPSNEPPAILRFTVNRFDLLKSCNAVYFSDMTNDGSFLLTGDCKAQYNNVVLSETFYAYFKSSGTKDGRNIYEVELSVSQDRENKKSLLYKFCERKNIIAVKTGNLITIRESTEDYSSDMLIDIGK
ncbi:MAG: hypothetical protein KBS84_04200 [Treponema sp.]|nr:hypothetical protein [Candidatus Treponema scatequi]